jgi:hypothetical protein
MNGTTTPSKSTAPDTPSWPTCAEQGTKYNALPDFAFGLESVTVTPKGARVVQAVGMWTFVNDMSRKKATGKGFRYKTVNVMEIDDERLITKNGENYSAWFDEGVDLDSIGS